MQLIGLTGYATSGKSEAARLLNEEFGLVRISYSDPLYEAALAIDPIIHVTSSESAAIIEAVPFEICDRWLTVPVLGTTGKDEGMRQLGSFAAVTPRMHIGGYFHRLQQIVDVIGWTSAKTINDVRAFLQKLGTEAGRDIHGQDCWIRIAERKMIAADFHCVFENVRFVNEAQMVRDAGGIIIRIERPGVTSVNSHVSDAGLPAEFINCTIVNDGTIEDLRAKVRAVVLNPPTPATPNAPILK